MKMFSCLLSGLFLVGCQTTPAVELGWSVKFPATVRQQTVHNPTTTANTVYVPVPVITGQAPPAPAPAPVNPVIPPQPVRQLLPMPKEGSGCGQPCQPAGGGE